MPSIAPIYLTDSNGQTWLVSITNAGLLEQSKVSGAGLSAVLINDVSTGNTWSLYITTTGQLQVKAATNTIAPIYLYAVSPNGTTWEIQVNGGLIQQAVAPPCCQFQLSDAIAALAARLYDPTNQFWSAAELTLYIQEAIQTWNALTSYWRGDFTFQSQANVMWYDITSTLFAPNSLRLVTYSATTLYNLIEYHLLEPANGYSPWTGSLQFTLTDLSAAIRRRRDELLGETGCVITRLPISATYSRPPLPSNIIDIRRIAYVATPPVAPIYLTDPSGQTWLVSIANNGDLEQTKVSVSGPTAILLNDVNTGTTWILSITTAGNLEFTSALTNTLAPNTLYVIAPNGVLWGIQISEGNLQQVVAPSSGVYTNLFQTDQFGLQTFKVGYTGDPAGTPSVYAVSTEPWLTFDVDTPPGPGNYELLVIQTGTVCREQDPTVQLEVPNDWVWLIKWGALADLLSRESVAKDEVRAKYCEGRYRQGMTLLSVAPAVLQARINNVPVQLDAVHSADLYQVGWQNQLPGQPTNILTAGLNLLAATPTPNNANYSITITCVENAPIPVNLTDCIMLGRDLFDVIIDYAQHLAAFKMGGEEFLNTMPLYDRFVQEAVLYNSKLQEQGEFQRVLYQLSQRDSGLKPRYTVDADPGAKVEQ